MHENKPFVDELKSLNPCSDCKLFFDSVCMDYDHRPGEIKVGTISYITRRISRELLVAEIAKCDLVCACCHRIRTKKRGRKKISPEGLARMKAAQNRPDVKERKSRAQSKTMQKPEYRAHQSSVQKIAQNRPDVIEKNAASHRKNSIL